MIDFIFIDTLPRIPEDNKYSQKGMSYIKEYKPKKEWTDKQKYFGQNDYIGNYYLFLPILKPDVINR